MKLRRLTGAAAGLTLLAAGAVACSSDESVFNAEVGECIESISDLSGNISELPETECTDDHEAEIFFLFEHDGDDDDFPGTDELQEEAAEDCAGDEFEDYFGVPYSDTTIEISMVTPSEDSWGDGDRETICIGFVPDEELDESLEGNGEDYPLEGAETGDDTTTTEGDAGEDTSLEDFADLIESCEGGDMADCDTLYGTTPIGSQAEEIGATCGGESTSATSRPARARPSSADRQIYEPAACHRARAGRARAGRFALWGCSQARWAATRSAISPMIRPSSKSFGV